MKKTKRTNGAAAARTNPSNPKGWQLGVRIYAPLSGDVRLLRLAAKKVAKGGYTAALDASGERIQVRVKNNPAAIGKAVVDLENGVHGIPVG